MTPFPYARFSPVKRAVRAREWAGELHDASITIEFQYRILNYGNSSVFGSYSEILYPMEEDTALSVKATGYPHIGMVPDYAPASFTGNMLAPPPAGPKAISFFDVNEFIPYNGMQDETTTLESSDGDPPTTGDDHRRLSLRFRLARPTNYDSDIQTIRRDVPFRASFARIDLLSFPGGSGIPVPEEPGLLFGLGSDNGYFVSSADGVEWGPWSEWIAPGGPLITQEEPGFIRSFRYSCLGRDMIHCGPTFAMTRAEAHNGWGAA